ncbi:hypothetical protein KKG66_09565, partial [bacterium]|nr:hypothetical protein [bacterium]
MKFGHGGFWLFILCCLFSTGCKDKVAQTDPYPIYPPVGAAFSAESGEVTFFSLLTNEITVTREIGEVVSSAAFALPGTALYLANNYLGKIAIYSLPHMERIDLLETGGVPLDLCLNRVATKIFLINANGNFRRFGRDDTNVDTLGVGLAPRRLTLKPVEEMQVWIACRGDSSVYIVDLLDFFAHDTLHFQTPPSDVCFSLGGDIAYIALQNGHGIARLSSDTFAESSRLSAGPGPIDLALSHEGTMLVASDSTLGEVRIWNFESGASWTQMDIPVGGSAGRIRFASNNTFYVISRAESHVVCIDLRGPTPEIIDT